MKDLSKLFTKLKNDGFKTMVCHSIAKFKSVIFFLLNKILHYIPLQNTIVFECESDMDDNPRAIYEYMITEKQYSKYRFVWIVKDVEYCKKNYAHKSTVFISRFDSTLRNRLALNYYLSTAKYLLFSHPHWFKKVHKRQIVIHTTHGTPFKNHEKNVSLSSDSYDFVLCASEYTRGWFLKILNCPIEKTFICPHPRLDLLNSKQNRQTVISSFFECESTDKIIICMPTYKQSCRLVDCDVVDKYSLSVISTENEFLKLNEFLKERNIHLIVKLHPLQAIEKLSINDATNIHYIQNKELFDKKIQLYNLIGCCDAMITDFSSVMFDYILLNKPIAFFTNFFDQYNRGYIMDNPKDYMCGETINGFDDLINFLTNIYDGNDVFQQQRNYINNIINNPTPNNCCQKFVESMFNLKLK